MTAMAYLWLGIAITMGVLEAATVNLVSIWFMGGAIVSFLAALFGAPIYLQVILFFLVSVLLLLLFRKTLWKSSRKSVVPTNADRFIGQTAVVTQSIDNLKGEGAVKIAGMEWTARTKDGKPISAHTQVTVHAIEGVTMIVSPATIAIK